MAFLAVRLQDSKRVLVRLVDERTRQLQGEKERADALLYSLLPKHIADVLKAGGVPPNKTFSSASVLFIDIANFTSLCERSSPSQIVELLNDVFSMWDELIQLHGVTKVDMIGDCLIVCAGVMDERADHAVRLVDFALDAVAAIATLDSNVLQQTGPIQVRVGICSGSLATGVVGVEVILLL